MAYVPGKDSDQPGHPPSLIRVFAVGREVAHTLSYPLSAEKILIRLGGFEFSCDKHATFLVFIYTGKKFFVNLRPLGKTQGGKYYKLGNFLKLVMVKATL